MGSLFFKYISLSNFSTYSLSLQREGAVWRLKGLRSLKGGLGRTMMIFCASGQGSGAQRIAHGKTSIGILGKMKMDTLAPSSEIP